MESANSVTLYSLLNRFNLDEGECSREVTKAHLEELCKTNFAQWRLLPPPLALDVESISVDDIERSAVEEYDRKLSFFYQWKHMKGTAATYQKLILSLLAIKCEEEAGNVCKVLKRDATVHHYPVRGHYRWAHHEEEYTQKSRSSFIRGFSADIRMDLKHQLQLSVRAIINSYASFVSRLCSSLIDNQITSEILSSYLLSLPAFKDDCERNGRGLVLMSGVRDGLEKATSVYDVINTLSVDHASFMNCDIYKSIVKEFGRERDHEQLDHYLEKLQVYIDKHKLIEFIELGPTFGRVPNVADQLIFKLDIDMTMRVSQLLELRHSLADVLGLWGSTLRLFNAEEAGCVVITFLIYAVTAREVFDNVEFTAKQVQEFQALSVVWIKYCDVVYDFTEISAGGEDKDRIYSVRKAGEASVEAL